MTQIKNPGAAKQPQKKQTSDASAAASRQEKPKKKRSNRRKTKRAEAASSDSQKISDDLPTIPTAGDTFQVESTLDAINKPEAANSKPVAANDKTVTANEKPSQSQSSGEGGSHTLLEQVSELLDRHLKWEAWQAEQSKYHTQMLERLEEQDLLLQPVIDHQSNAEQSERNAESKIDEVNDNLTKLGERSAKLEDELEQSIAKLGKRSEKLEADLGFVVELLVDQNEALAIRPSVKETQDDSNSERGEELRQGISALSEEFEQVSTRHGRFEEMMTSVLDLMINQHKVVNNGFQDVTAQIAELSNSGATIKPGFELGASSASKTKLKTQASDPKTVKQPPKKMSAWDAKKADLLAQYQCESEIPDLESFGVDMESQPVENSQATECATTKQEDVQKPGKTEKDSEAKVATSEDHEEIARLRTELESKLRKAEIEISIERAKIARMQAELEVKKSEIDSATQKFEEMKESASKVPNNTRLLSRLSRWLPRSTTTKE